ncbi:MAG: hypothetical protein WEB88_03880 [Gemmatimonadota bacterium]
MTASRARFSLAACALLGLGLAVAPAQAQAPPNGEPPPLRIYLDCRTCDDDYMKQEIPWVEYMRDRTDADVHVLASGEGLGGGGMQYYINFIGRGEFAGVSDTLQYTHGITDTDDERRQGLTRTVQLGLLPFLANRPQARDIQIVYRPTDTTRSPRATTAQDDPWNFWVFRPNMTGSFDKQDRSENYNIRGGLSASRTTREWKLDFDLNGNVRRESRTLSSGSEVRNDRDFWNTSGMLVKSVGPHMGMGVRASASSSTVSNRKFSLEFAPAVEYSLFNYDEATRRQVTVTYAVGINSFEYIDETIFGKMEETVAKHSVDIGASFRQPWGTASGSIEGSNYFHDASLRSLSLGANANIRLFRGFGLNISGNADWIRDDLSTKANLSDEDVLLGRRNLPTNSRYRSSIGFNYTFGSIFSSVVNPRFETRRGRGGPGGF